MHEGYGKVNAVTGQDSRSGAAKGIQMVIR